MKIVVIGGSGLIGSRLVDLLRENCQDVVSTSRADGVNTVTGEGLDDVLEGAEVVFDVTKPPSLDGKAAREFYETSGQNIIAAEIRAGVEHHIALSVVGTDRLQERGTFGAKLAQEKLIRQSPVPYTILRATQFFEFLRAIADDATVEGRVLLPPALVQPVAADDVAAALAELAFSAPANGIVEVAGPERFRLVELIRRYLLATGDTRPVSADEKTAYFGARVNDDALMPGTHARIGMLTLEAWLSEARSKALAAKPGQVTRPVLES